MRKLIFGLLLIFFIYGCSENFNIGKVGQKDKGIQMCGSVTGESGEKYQVMLGPEGYTIHVLG